MFEAIYHSRHTKLKKFELHEMGLSVEANPDIHELILDFMSRQERLEYLNCSGTMTRTAEHTTKFIETLMQSEASKTIQEVYLQEADFTEDETC